MVLIFRRFWAHESTRGNWRAWQFGKNFSLIIFFVATVALPALANPTQGDIHDRKNPWKLTVPQDQVSPTGMPTGQLFYLLRRHKFAEYRQLLKSTPVKPNQKAERNMWEACQLATETRFEEAVELFNKIPNLMTTPIIVRSKAAICYAMLTQYDKAIALTNSILDKYQMDEAYKTRAGSYAATGRLLDAAVDFEKLGDLESDDTAPGIYSKAASLLLKSGKVDKAMAILEKAQKRPGSERRSVLYMVRTDCLKAKGRWQDAIKNLDHVIALNMTGSAKSQDERNVILSTCLKERALCYRKIGRNDLADKDMKTLADRNASIVDEMIGRH